MVRILPAALGLFLLFLPVFLLAQDRTQPSEPPEAVQELLGQLFTATPRLRNEALEALKQRGKTDVVPALIQALRFVPDEEAINATLEALVGERSGTKWPDWMLWQEAHPEIEPFAGFDAFKAEVMATIDENFRLFLRPGIKHDIRLEEIVWSGVRKDGIPTLINLTHTGAAEAGYLDDDELVFGVEINGDARAYPLRILDWHEMFNDVVGACPWRVPIARSVAPASSTRPFFLPGRNPSSSDRRASSTGRTS